MSLTREQAAGAYANGSVAVVAGAGTGKTHMLTERYLHHLLSDGLSPLQIVAVTFTERAADELKARLRRATSRRLGDDATALIELEAAQISTLHALAARICRDHPDAAGVPADFGILEDLEGDLWQSEQLDDALMTLSRAVLDSVPFSTLREVVAALVADPVRAQEALDRGPETWDARVAQARISAVAQLVHNPAWREAVLSLRTYQGQAGDRKEQARQHALQGLDCLDAGEVETAFEHFDRIDRRGGSQKAWPVGGLAEVNEALRVIQEQVKAVQKEGLVTLRLGEADTRLAELLPMIREAYEHVQNLVAAAKRRARVLDFADLELHALAALGHEQVRQHYRERWRAILIDEFQDTNPVQEALLNHLTGGLTLTIVGDEKQAIYGFRGADVAVFQRYRQRIASSGGSEVTLSTSFRTHTRLVEQLNPLFEPVLGDLHQPLEAVRREVEDEHSYLSVHTIEAERGVSKGRRQLAEARCIAGLIADLLAKGRLIDPDTGRARAVEPGDIAVLTRTWQPLDVYSEVLPAMGVPAVHTGGGNLLEAREAKDGWALLRFLVDPSDDLALVAALRSPFFAVDDRCLYDFVHTCEQASWWQALNRASADELCRAYRVLSTLRESVRVDAPSRLLQRADYLTGYTAVIANLPGAERRVADWRGFLELVRTLEGWAGDAFSVVRRLRRLIGAGTEVTRPVLQAANAVALMTIHKAKGLEWPVVIVGDLDRRLQGRRGSVLFDPELGLAFKVEDDEGDRLEPALYTLLKHQRAQAEAAELRRVCYVALTRARDRLILTATQAKGGAFEVLQPGFDRVGLEYHVVPYSAEAGLYPEPQPPEPLSVVSEDQALWRVPVTALGAYAGHVAPRHEVRPETDKVEGWEEVLGLIEAVDEAWLPLALALQAAGLPAPNPDSVFRELTSDAVVTAYQAVCSWEHQGQSVAVVDAATPQSAFDQQLIRVPFGDADGITHAVMAIAQALGRASCAS